MDDAEQKRILGAVQQHQGGALRQEHTLLHHNNPEYILLDRAVCGVLDRAVCDVGEAVCGGAVCGVLERLCVGMRSYSLSIESQ